MAKSCYNARSDTGWLAIKTISSRSDLVSCSMCNEVVSLFGQWLKNGKSITIKVNDIDAHVVDRQNIDGYGKMATAMMRVTNSNGGSNADGDGDDSG